MRGIGDKLLRCVMYDGAQHRSAAVDGHVQAAGGGRQQVRKLHGRRKRHSGRIQAADDQQVLHVAYQLSGKELDLRPLQGSKQSLPRTSHRGGLLMKSPWSFFEAFLIERSGGPT